MLNSKKFLRSLFTPITIMVIPHSNEKTYRFKLPSIGIVTLISMWVSITCYIVSVGVTTQKYNEIKGKADYYASQFGELRSTIGSLKRSEAQFKNLFSVKDKESVFKNMDISDSGSIDMDLLKKQIDKSIETVGEIKDYLRQERNSFYATPMGVPVENSRFSSGFGYRIHPNTGKTEFHSGVDLAVPPGTPVKATADGIVSFADWSGGSGKLVVVEHGFGYTTCYAHNREINVKIGQRVKRGDVLSYVGSTGNTTGPHVHYEVWKNNTPVDPKPFLERQS
ncbi:MAG: M23 family metallopeptidase [Nitrospirae bacterium]|nr:M23 family metallopeptidase [Nitrospirota bacterium]